MTDKKITDLTAATSFSTSDLINMVVSSNSRKVAVSTIYSMVAQSTLAAGTLTDPAPMTLTQTWNDAADTFTGFKLNITDTASAAASLPLDVQVGGTSKFNVKKDGSVTAAGQILAPTGTVSAPGLALSTDPTTGIRFALGKISLVAGGGDVIGGNTSAFGFRNTSPLGWYSGIDVLSGSLDLTLYRDAADTLAQRRGTNAQVYRVYGTYTDASNYERLSASYQSGSASFLITTESAGTGTARALTLGANGTNYWQVRPTGSLYAVTDNSYDIGASAGNRPSNIYAANSFNSGGIYVAAATGQYNWTGRGRIYSPADGVIELTNNAVNDFSRLQFGGTTSSFPAIKRNAAGLDFRLADDSGYASIAVSGLATFGGAISLNPSSGLVTIPSNLTLLRGTSTATALSIGDGSDASSAGASILLKGTSSSSLVFGSASDLVLTRDASGVLAQRNGVNAQVFRVYNTYTDASNYEYGQLSWISNTLYVGTVAAGTGTPRDVTLSAAGAANVYLRTNGNNRWQVDTSGVLKATTDNAYDIGAVGANRPRTLFLGTAINSPSGRIDSIGVMASATGLAGINIGAGTTTKAQMNFAAGVAPTSPADGDIWFDGTNLKMQVGGSTKTFTLV